jgi:TRAP-type C4-dicarboxylate transport system substrate-binding protein
MMASNCLTYIYLIRKRRYVMKTRKLLILVAVISLVLIFALPPFPAPAEQKVIKWLGQNAYVGSPGRKGPFIANWIKEATGGRLIIDVKPPNAIVSVPAMFDAVAKGTIQFAGTYYAGYYASKFPETEIETGLPFSWPTGWEQWDAFENYGLREEFEKIYAEHNIKWFLCMSSSIYGLQATFPINSLADIKGKKIRASGIYGDYVKLLGASPVSIPYAETYEAMRRGTIDGAVIGANSLKSTKLWEVTKYFLTEPNASSIPTNYLINMDAWNALPADIKEILNRDLKFVDLHLMFMDTVEMEYTLIEAQKDHGVKMVSLSEGEKAKLFAIIAPLYDKVAALSPRCARLVDIVRKQQRALRKIR